MPAGIRLSTRPRIVGAAHFTPDQDPRGQQPQQPDRSCLPGSDGRGDDRPRAKPQPVALSDECYDQIVLDGSWTSPAKLAPDDDRIVTAFTFSKTYAMTGWRLGYIAGSADLIDTATKVLESNSSCFSTITQVASETALTRSQACAGEM